MKRFDAVEDKDADSMPLGAGHDGAAPLLADPMEDGTMDQDPPGPGVNFLVLAGYQVLMRVGWIFKTESIIMPAIMDVLCGPGTALAAWLRSWLPQLNRIGQSIPQLIAANKVKTAGQKKLVVAGCSGLMGMIFLALALLWWLGGGRTAPGMSVWFLVLYGLFFICVGVNNLGFNTLQGKLIRYDFRGRLFLVANSLGGGAAILAAWLLLTRWLNAGSTGFVSMFLFSGCCFLGSGVLVLLGKEKRDPTVGRLKKSNGAGKRKASDGDGWQKIVGIFLSPWILLKKDPGFRKLAMIAACFGTSMVLFPHYQALYRQAMEGSSGEFHLKDLVGWVIIQNLGTILVSFAAGPLADRLGNRMVLRCILVLIMSAPVAAVLITLDQQLARNFYFGVFLLVGVTPVTLRIINNFALEMVPPGEHPRYLSAISLCLALPVILFSQPVGLLIPIVGYSPIFFVISGVVLTGFIFTFFVAEPRSLLTEAVGRNDNLA